MTTRIEWSEIEDQAEAVFFARTGEPELWWAERAWLDLERQGLTAYSDLPGWIGVHIRLVALATLFHTFRAVAWNEFRRRPFEVAELIDLDPFLIGYLAGRTSVVLEDVDDECYTEAGIDMLVEKEHEVVVNALRKQVGSDSLLFASLWLAREGEWHGQGAIPDDLLDSILNRDLTVEKSIGFDWVRDGCPLNVA